MYSSRDERTALTPCEPEGNHLVVSLNLYDLGTFCNLLYKVAKSQKIVVMSCTWQQGE